MNPNPDKPKFLLPRLGSPGYHIMLAAVAIFILGPLGGVSAAFMNFSIGFFIGGQVLAGILGSVVTLPYGPEGRHGANYIQTMSASVAGMCGMGVLLQAMVWLGMAQPPTWQLVLFFTCIGMLGVGIGMLYTPVLVDRMQLAYPSGFAVANILRALTDPKLLKQSVAKLGGGMALGFTGGLASLKIPFIGATHLSMGTIGAGMIVGARLAIPALVVALIGHALTPYLQYIGWLKEGDTYRKIGFIIALGTILGAAGLDIVLILIEFMKQVRARKGQAAAPTEDWKRVNTWRLVSWVVFWAVALVLVGSQVLNQPVKFLALAVGLCFVFVLVNGISQGISDWNPISSAFVTTVFIMVAVGLKDPATGLMCASILLIACSVGGDMQQDRSTGWRLGTNRVNQFRYQVIGIVVGALLAVVLARTFMEAYPVLKQSQMSGKVEGAENWQSAMTLKVVGAIEGITDWKPHMLKAMGIGIGIGLLIGVIRRLVKSSAAYKRWSHKQRSGRVFDFCFDAILLPSPYASSFGGFVELTAVLWWTAGGLISAGYGWLTGRNKASEKKSGDTPEDMGTMSLLGGGMIAGDALSALSVGLYGLITTGALKKLLTGK
jgi:uncharacterized oligopeptide transporter (OPT) family protein